MSTVVLPVTPPAAVIVQGVGPAGPSPMTTTEADPLFMSYADLGAVVRRHA
jgi:hypothetical protein